MNQQNDSLSTGQLALIELARNDMHRMVDKKINSMLYRMVTQSEAEIEDSLMAFSSDTSSLKGLKPISVIFRNGNEVITPTWRKLATAVLKECDSDPKMHDRLMELRGIVLGRNRVILGADPSIMNVPIEINDDLYFESMFDTASLLLVLKSRVLNAVGYDHYGILIRYHDEQQNVVAKDVPKAAQKAWAEMLEEENSRDRRPLFKMALLVGVHEQLTGIEEQSRLTNYIGGYGGYVFRHGVSSRQIDEAYEQALDAAGLEDNVFQKEDRYCYAGEVIGEMRSHLLLEEVKPHERVLFVCTAGYDTPDVPKLHMGIIKDIDPVEMTCSIRKNSFTMTDVPLFHVLGRFDDSIRETHYGMKNVRPLFGEFPELTQHYLDEAAYRIKAAMQAAEADTPEMREFPARNDCEQGDLTAEKKSGWRICQADCSESVIPNALYIERDDDLMLFENDYEAAKAYEKSGGRIIHDMGDQVEDWTYIDTPENRKRITAFLEANPGWHSRNQEEMKMEDNASPAMTL